MVSKNSYQVLVEEKPDDDVWEIVAGGLSKFNQEKAGLKRTPPIAVVIRDKEQNVRGGLFGNSDWDVFNIDTVWIEEALRGRGFGRELLRLGENVAVERGCKIAVLMTISFQAREFYEKQGYKVFGQLDGYPAGYSSYWLTKKLV
jgi:ribosomal protein S18 acetylase RimI-like enzyme